MATNKFADSPASFNATTDIRKKKILGQQKREELEREVSALQKMLKQEEKVREILDLLQKKRDGNAISIPNFLPPKAKELLAELAMVESEIIRLETQITQLRMGLKREQQMNKEKQTTINWRNENEAQQLWSMPSPLHNKFNENHKTSIETKALHFISKAIKGDYTSNTNVNNTFSDKMVSNYQLGNDEPKIFGERVSIKSGILLKSPSPLRDPRHPSPKIIREQNGSISNAILSEESNIQQLQPNKLSENIMKCLNFIYIRLLRTSRAMELEKSGQISRSLQASLISRSSHRNSDTIGSSNPPLLQKESRQQDPYGIFYLEESIPRDIGPYKNLVIFTSTSLDPKCISSSSSIPLLRRLRVLMNNLENVDLRLLTCQQKLAFWINMYNACIMHGFIQYGVPSSPEKWCTLLSKATLKIGGNIINAEAIEQHILRKSPPSDKVQKNKEKEEKESNVIRKLYGLETMDPNVTFALCCGIRSSPAVKIYTGEGVVGELEKAKLEYLQASIIVTNTKRIAFPELLLRNMQDFATDTTSLVEWVCHQLPTAGSLRKSIVDCFRTHNSGKIATISVEKIPYDFEFQYLLAM